MTSGYTRYVAIGDSQTEGLNDGDERTGYRGWADRLAERLARANPELEYANLAVRGRLIGQVRAEQLEPAIAMRPDLATVVAGLNDIIRGEYDLDAAAEHLEAMIAALTGIGARVATLTYPNIGAVIPLAARWQHRVTAFNARVREIADRHGAVVVATDQHPVCVDRRIWSSDRLHLNPLGHALLADGFAEALDLPGADASWTRPWPAEPDPGPSRRVLIEARWAVTFLTPWLWRRLRGRSSGDGRVAKRPQLTPVHADNPAREPV